MPVPVITLLLAVGCTIKSLMAVEAKEGREWLLNALLFFIITVLLAAWR